MSILPLINDSVIKRFWKYTDKRGDDECWDWIGHTQHFGYGRLWIGSTKSDGRKEGAHRISWVIHYGEIPVGLFVCHHCDNPKCVNPKHLFVGTQADNLSDMIAKERGQPGTKHWNAKLTEEDVLEIRDLLKSGMQQKDIATIFGVGEMQISRIKKGTRWGHLK